MDINQQVGNVLQGLIDDGSECGVQVAACLDGKLVVDAWAGLAHEPSSKPVAHDTLFPIFSAAKVGAITSIHLLVDRGLLDYDTRVAEYWPEFAANGKAQATVRHILTHSIGIPDLPPGITVDQLCDFEWMVHTVAQMTPKWEPGTKTGYHPQVFHWLAGETIRRVSGMYVRDFINQNIKQPWKVEDFYIGIPDDILPRISPAYEREDTDRQRTSGDIPDLLDRANGLQVWRSIFRGISDARSLARIYAGLAAGGELDGVRILKPERVKIATQLQTDAFDQTQRRPVKKGLGYRIDEGGQDTFGHTGGGGSLGFAEPAKQFAFAYAKNLHGGKPLSNEKRAESQESTPARYAAFKVRQSLGLI